MSNKDKLVGKTVSLFLDGGWEVTGEVMSADENKFIVEQDGGLYMVFKDKVSCLLMSRQERALDPGRQNVEQAALDKAKYISAYDDLKEKDKELFPMNRIGYDDSGMTIPGDLLNDLPEQFDDDLSVSFGNVPESVANDAGEKSLQPASINFKVDEDDSTNKD
jgi:sRNA-binding regulator protein Hfq